MVTVLYPDNQIYNTLLTGNPQQVVLEGLATSSREGMPGSPTRPVSGRREFRLTTVINIAIFQFNDLLYPSPREVAIPLAALI